MQIKAGIAAIALASASVVSASPIDNGLTQKHLVFNHNDKVCITKHQVNACASGYRPQATTHASMQVICRSRFDDDTIRRAKNGEKIDEFEKQELTQYIKHQVPTVCGDEQYQTGEQLQHQQQYQTGARRAGWQSIRGAYSNKQQGYNKVMQGNDEQELLEKLNRFQQNQIPRVQQPQQHEKSRQQFKQVKQAIRKTWQKLSLHRVMHMSQKEHQKVQEQLRRMLALQPQEGNWYFKHEQELPNIFAKLADTLSQYMVQPYWEDRQLSKMLYHQTSQAATRVYTYLIKQLIVERDQWQKEQGKTDDEQQKQQQQQQQYNNAQYEETPELEEMITKVWEAAKEELHHEEISHAEKTYKQFTQQLKEEQPEAYQQMQQAVNQYSNKSDKQQTEKITKKLLQLVISAYQVSNPEHPIKSIGQEKESTEQRDHQLPRWNEEQLQEAEQQLRASANRDWSEFERKQERQQKDDLSSEYNSQYDDEQEYNPQQWISQQQQSTISNLFDKLKVAYQRFQKQIRGQDYN